MKALITDKLGIKNKVLVTIVSRKGTEKYTVNIGEEFTTTRGKTYIVTFGGGFYGLKEIGILRKGEKE